MKKIDARKHSTETQQYNRHLAIRLHLKGKSRQEIAQLVGLHPSTLGAWVALYNKGGLESAKEVVKREKVVS